MKGLVLSIALALPIAAQEASQPPQQPQDPRMPMVNLDGQWTVIYAEMGGKKIDNKDITQVTIKNNVVTCRHNGKEKSWHLHFGPHHMIRCTETVDGKLPAAAAAEAQPSEGKSHHSHHGVYIASHDFFCLSLNKGHDRRFSTEQPVSDGRQAREDRPRTPRADGAHFVLILQRSSSTATPKAP